VSATHARPLRVLLVEDDENDAFLIARLLERDGFAPAMERVFTSLAMQSALERSDFDVVLSDFTMPGFDALKALRVLEASGKDLPFIVVSGTIGERVAVEAMKAGAHDYFSKSSLERLATAIEREMREARVRRERHEALANQRATEEQLRLVVDSVREYAIYMLDLRGAVASWHPGAGRLYGYTEIEAIGRPFARFFQGDDVVQGKPDEILARVRTDGRYQGELFQVCKEGALFWADATLARLRDEEGRLRGFSVVVRDITDQVKLVEDLRVAVRSRDEFLSMASHELRTPVTTLQLQLQTLHRVLDRSNEQVPRDAMLQRAQNLERQTSRIALLVGDLLDLSRMRLGKIELELDELDLAELARETVERLRPQAVRAGCALSLRADSPAVGRWDRLRIEQVLTNLITNAVKFGDAKPIVVSVAGDEERVWIMVEDHGIGIAPENQSRVFDRFERAASPENYGGLGLGLYIARQIVEAHGGTIALRSTPGAGSTFTVELRREPEVQIAGSDFAPPSAPHADSAGL
jgi:PAS domain S-box-containing protein